MLNSAFIVPHSPILLPTVGKNNTALLEKTLKAYEEIETKLLQEQIETLVVISPHAPRGEKAFIINSAPEFTISFKNFGDFATKVALAGDVALAHEIKEYLKNTFGIKLVSHKQLDYGTAIPLYLLPNLKNIKVISISHSELDLKTHYNFGESLKKILVNTEQKIALLASGDLSHRLKRSAPGGYSPKGAKFDNKVIEYLNNPATAVDNLLKMDHKFIAEVMECGLKSILMLLGALTDKKYEPQMLAYQTDLGIGYLTMDMNIIP